MILGVIFTLATVLLIVSGILWFMKPSKNIKRVIKGTAGASAAAMIITALLAGLGGTTSTASTVDTRSGNPSVDLTVKTGDLLPAAAKCTGGDTWNQNSQPHTTGRLWTQSVSTPFTATDANAQFKELTSEICLNPTLGDAYAQAFEDAKIGSFSVGNANPWLATMLQQSSTDMKSWLTFKVDSKGSYLMTGTGKDATKTEFVTANYQSDAELINTLLYVLDNQGTKTATSTVNWPLGALVDGMPRVYKATSPSEQENLPFMALTYTLKNGGCPYVLGVNLKDKRPENVACNVAVHIAPTTPTAPKLTVTPTPTTTPTGPTSTPTPSTPTSPPGTCVWSNGSVHKLSNGKCPKDPGPIPTNSYHTPAGPPSGPASAPSHPATPANPSTTPGSGSTQTAPGASSAPTPSTPAPVVLPSATGTSCIPDPDTGKGC